MRILPTLYDGRTRYARQTLGEIRERFGDLCFDTVIRQNVKLREAAQRGRPIASVARTRERRGRLRGARGRGRGDARPTRAARGLRPAATRAREVVVRFRDPRASDVRIAGDFNGWVPDKGVRSLIEAEGADARVDEDPAAAAGPLPVPLRRRRRVARGSGEPGDGGRRRWADATRSWWSR